MKPFRVAVLGSGAVTNVLYLPALREVRNEIDLAGVAELNRQSAEPLLKEFPSAKFFADYSDDAARFASGWRHRSAAAFSP